VYAKQENLKSENSTRERDKLISNLRVLDRIQKSPKSSELVSPQTVKINTFKILGEVSENSNLEGACFMRQNIGLTMKLNLSCKARQKLNQQRFQRTCWEFLSAAKRFTGIHSHHANLAYGLSL